MQNKIHSLKESLRDLEQKQDELLGKIEKKIDKRRKRNGSEYNLRSQRDLDYQKAANQE